MRTTVTDPGDPHLSIGPVHSGGENRNIKMMRWRRAKMPSGDPIPYRNHQLCLLFYTVTNFGIEVISVVKCVVGVIALIRI